MTLRLNGATSGYSEIDAPAVAGDQTFTLPGTGGTLDRLNRAGNILQVVSATTGTVTSVAAGGFTDVTGMSVSITPTFASSKILLYFEFRCGSNASSNNGVQILRNATALSLGGTDTTNLGNLNFAGASGFVNTSFTLVDTPNTTSALTYKLQVQRSAGTLTINARGDGVNIRNGTVTAMEVAS